MILLHLIGGGGIKINLTEILITQIYKSFLYRDNVKINLTEIYILIVQDINIKVF